MFFFLFDDNKTSKHLTTSVAESSTLVRGAGVGGLPLAGMLRVICCQQEKIIEHTLFLSSFFHFRPR